MPQPQFINKVVDDRVKVQRQVPQSKWRGNETVDVSPKSVQQTKWRISVVQQRTDAARAVPKSSEENRDSTIAHTTLEKTVEERDTLNQAVVRIVNGTVRAWSTQYEIWDPPRSSRQWRCRRKPNTANMRILQGEGDQQSEISQARGKQQDCDSVEQQSSAQDPGAHQKMSRARNRSTK